ncbi:MAG: hypothetical protein R3C03_18000 [Pirellulaceae bacterium]
MLGNNEIQIVDAFMQKIGFIHDPNASRIANTWVDSSGSTPLRISIVGMSRTKYYGDVRMRRRHSYRITMFAELPFATRASVCISRIGDGRFISWLNRRRGNHRLAISRNEYSDLAIWSIDPQWMGSVFDDGSVAAAVGRLFREQESERGHLGLWIVPNELQFNLRIRSLHQLERINELLPDIRFVYQRLQSATTPKITSRLSFIEVQIRQRPWLTVILFFVIALFVLFSCVAIPIVVLIGIALLFK